MPYLSDIPQDILARAARIRLLALDVDGTLTDGRLLYGEDGHEWKAFNVQDGHGLKRVMAHGVDVALVSARVSHVVALRAEELGIDHVYQGQSDKRACLADLLHGANFSAEHAAFAGDDLTDLRAMGAAGFAIAVANAHPWVIERAHWCTKLAGGRGAVREICDLLLLAQGKLQAELDNWLESP
ncbi:MAG TPA: HAD hydrolase family protein [Rhodanobacteraceae bacterium]|nr:HAD hydrolase family protein [Rhodanobacteraceae bacterium]